MSYSFVHLCAENMKQLETAQQVSQVVISVILSVVVCAHLILKTLDFVHKINLKALLKDMILSV